MGHFEKKMLFFTRERSNAKNHQSSSFKECRTQRIQALLQLLNLSSSQKLSYVNGPYHYIVVDPSLLPFKHISCSLQLFPMLEFSFSFQMEITFTFFFLNEGFLTFLFHSVCSHSYQNFHTAGLPHIDKECICLLCSEKKAQQVTDVFYKTRYCIRTFCKTRKVSVQVNIDAIICQEMQLGQEEHAKSVFPCLFVIKSCK